MKTDLLLPRSTPAKQGVSPTAILEFLDDVARGRHELHSLMIVRHGRAIAQGAWTPYQFEAPHMLLSLSKSFTSTAAGFAVSEGLLSVDDKVISLFPDKLPGKVSENLHALRVRDLLTMTVGHSQDSMETVLRSPDGDWVRSVLSQTVEYKPGTHFLYNSGATYMVSAIVQKLTGKTVVEYTASMLGQTYRFPENFCGMDAVRFDADALKATFEAAGKQHVFRAGLGNWVGNEATATFDLQRPFPPQPSYRVGGAAAWDADTLSLRLAYVETPFSLLGSFRFYGNKLEAQIDQNVTFSGPRACKTTGVAQ